MTFICINIQVSRLPVCVRVCVPGGERGVWLRLHHTWIYSLLRLSGPGDLWNEPGSSPFGGDIKFQFRANVSAGGQRSKCTSDEWVCHLQITAGDVCEVTFPVLDSKPLLSWINVMVLLFCFFFISSRVYNLWGYWIVGLASIFWAVSLFALTGVCWRDWETENRKIQEVFTKRKRWWPWV